LSLLHAARPPSAVTTMVTASVLITMCPPIWTDGYPLALRTKLTRPSTTAGDAWFHARSVLSKRSTVAIRSSGLSSAIQ
jgi:hypothetical protein